MGLKGPSILVGRLVTVAAGWLVLLASVALVHANAHDNLVLGLLGGDEAGGDEELLDGDTLVALELEDLAVLVLLARGGRVLVVRVGRVHDVAVAGKLLLHGLEELAGVVLVRDALDGSDRLAAITLLETWGMGVSGDVRDMGLQGRAGRG